MCSYKKIQPWEKKRGVEKWVDFFSEMCAILLQFFMWWIFWQFLIKGDLEKYCITVRIFSNAHFKNRYTEKNCNDLTNIPRC